MMRPDNDNAQRATNKDLWSLRGTMGQMQSELEDTMRLLLGAQKNTLEWAALRKELPQRIYRLAELCDELSARLERWQDSVSRERPPSEMSQQDLAIVLLRLVQEGAVQIVAANTPHPQTVLVGTEMPLGTVSE